MRIRGLSVTLSGRSVEGAELSVVEDHLIAGLCVLAYRAVQGPPTGIGSRHGHRYTHQPTARSGQVLEHHGSHGMRRYAIYGHHGAGAPRKGQRGSPDPSLDLT